MERRNASESTGGRQSHSHHHRRKKPLYRRIRHWILKHKRQIAATAAVCVVAAGGIGLLIRQQLQKQESMQITAGNSHDVGNSYRELTYKGKKYRYNPLVRTILYAGIDEEDVLTESKQYGNKGRADSIALVVMDKQKQKITILPINRDTMTQVRRYSLNGNDNGLYTTHIGYAYAYGNGGKVSCENLMEAVSLLLGEITIGDYVVTSQASMPYINDLADGVTVTVPNNDLAEQYSELYQGNKVTLTDNNVTSYLQYRDTEETFSNEGRMERQKSFVTAFINQLKQMSTGTLDDKWDELGDMEDYLQTSITRNKYLDLVTLIKNLDFSEENYDSIPGKDQEGELHDEFIPDEEGLQEKIIELFYEEV